MGLLPFCHIVGQEILGFGYGNIVTYIFEIMMFYPTRTFCRMFQFIINRNVVKPNTGRG